MSGEDDITEILVTQKSEESNGPDTQDPELDQEGFLKLLGLLTHDALKQLMSRKKERKRRSTANPNYVWDIQEVRTLHFNCLQANNFATFYFRNVEKKKKRPLLLISSQPIPFKLVKLRRN